MKKITTVLSLLLIYTTTFVSPSFASFPDVTSTHPNVTAIEYLQKENIIAGYQDGTFQPTNKINRAEFLKIVVGAKYNKSEIDGTEVSHVLSDVKKDDWFMSYVSFALKHNIVSGYPDKTFKPANTINLAEALKIIIEAYQITKPVYVKTPVHWYDPYFDTAHTNNLLASVSQKEATGVITRGDVAQIIYNALHLGTPASIDEVHKVTKVIDGDTLDVDYYGKTERVRLIGVDTPETVHPSEPVQCFGKEASEYTKQLLLGKEVEIVTDLTQGERDKYNRLLGYIFLEGININQQLIEEGYAFEYTYTSPYQYQEAFQNAEKEAQNNQKGLWNVTTCNGEVTSIKEENTTNTTPPTTSCTIKGNISSSGEKIYHMEGCRSYTRTKIDESNGEKWFCSPEEAEEAGWRKAGNC